MTVPCSRKIFNMAERFELSAKLKKSRKKRRNRKKGKEEEETYQGWALTR